MQRDLGKNPTAAEPGAEGAQLKLLSTWAWRLSVALALTAWAGSLVISRAQSPALEPKNQQTLEVQLALERLGISSGSIDGVMGPKTRAALRAFQQQTGLPASGWLDPETQARLFPLSPPAAIYTNYVITQDDLARLRPLGKTWLSKSMQDRLDYETILELVAERSHASPTLIRRLNPGLDWGSIGPGSTLLVPNAPLPPVREKAAFIRISLGERSLQAYDSQTNLMAHFPCSIGRELVQRPLGELQVEVMIPDPNYTFNPATFPESAEGRQLGRKLVLPPGPNNPVGTAWIGLNRPGYGIHGTPQPERVGRAESHGCFRLTNWAVEHLLKLVWLTMPVYIEP